MLVVILTAIIQQWWVMSFSCGTIHLYPTIGLMNYGILAALVLGVTAAFFNKGFRLAGLTGPVLFRCCDHFLTMQAALFVGFLRFCRGNLRGEWRRTPR
jgi:hypothetical protein